MGDDDVTTTAGDRRPFRVTGTAQREAWRTKVMPPVERIRSGVWCVPVPIPRNPLRYTLTYLLEHRDGLVVVDPGWESDPGRVALEDGMRDLGASWSDVAGVVVTHVHPDHHGLSQLVKERSGGWVAMHPAEAASLPGGAMRTDAIARDDDWLHGCGTPQDAAEELRMTARMLEPFTRMARPDVLLEDADRVPGGDWRAVWTPGHTAGHLCLHHEAAALFLTGDHVLPRISPNISLHPFTDEPPLAAYLASLRKVAAYDSAEALPAHEYRFTGLAARVETLLAHHEERCGEIEDVVARLEEPTVWQVAERLTWSRGWDGVQGLMRRAALAETAAHLQYLRGLARIRARRVDRTWVFSLPVAADGLTGASPSP